MAKKDNGWIRLSRSILDSEIWRDDEPFDYRSAWIDLILMVNFEDKTFITRHNAIIDIKRGSVFTSIQHLSDRWHWSKGKVRRYITLLKKLGMIEFCGTADGTLLTLVNYRKYQDVRHTDGSPDGSPDGSAGGSRLNKVKNEKERKKRAGAPVSMSETMEALKKWAAKGDEE